MMTALLLAVSLFHHHKPPTPVLPPIPTVVLGIDNLATITNVSNATFLANRAADECPELGTYIAAVRADIDQVNADDVMSGQYATDAAQLNSDVNELSAQLKNCRSLYFL